MPRRPSVEDNPLSEAKDRQPHATMKQILKTRTYNKRKNQLSVGLFFSRRPRWAWNIGWILNV